MARPSRIEDFAGAPGEAHLAAIRERLVADPGRLVGLWIDMGDVRYVDRRFLLDDAAGLAGAGRGVPLHHVHALDDDAILLAQHAQDLAAPALVAAGDDDDLVALLDLQLRGHLRAPRAPETRS